MVAHITYMSHERLWLTKMTFRDGGARNEVKEGEGLRIKDRGLDCFHGDKGDVVEGVPFNSLY
jgi:hypothetical protein